jgi:hypothetical protein
LLGKTLLFTLALAAALPSTGAAGTLGLTFDRLPGQAMLMDDAEIGWSFTTINTLAITALGYYDEDGDGLFDSHQVGIWTTGGVLQGSATVTSGTSATLVSGFRFVDVSFSLDPGTYIIGAFKPSGDDTHISNVASSDFSTAPGITYGDPYYTFSPTFSMPNNPFPPQGNGYFGPNFQFDGATPTPEPTTLSLAGIACAALFLVRRRK